MAITLDGSNGITTPGGATTDDITFADNDKAIFGAGSDLQIYHDGSDSFISDQGTGNLKILANDFRLANAANNELMIAGNQSGAVTAYYAGSAKLATTLTGIDVTGTVTADGIINDSAQWIKFGSANTFFSSASLGLLIQTPSGNNNTIFRNSSGVEKMRIDSSGQVGIGTISPTKALDVEGNIRAKVTGGTSAAEIDMTSGGTWRLRSNPTSGTNAYGMDIVKGSAGTDVKLSIDSSGKVGIGLANPAALLEVEGSQDNNWAGRFENTHSGGYGVLAVTAGSTANDRAFEVRKNTSQTAMMVLGTGNVGIGTSSPSAPIDVVTNSNVYAAEFTQSNTSNGDGVQIVVGSTASSDYALTVRSDGGNTSGLAVKADGKVGIGTFLPSNTLTVNTNMSGEGSQDGGIKIINSHGTNSDVAPIYFGVHGGEGRTKAAIGLKREGSYGTGSLIFAVDSNGDDANVTFANDEKMRLDNSGNLLVGKTSPDFNSAGIALRPTEGLIATVSNSECAMLNRQTSDGNILRFKKDGADVGSIGVRASSYAVLRLGSTGTGITSTNSHKILPSVNNARSDNTNDLGDSSYRWKDAYLSGGLYLGGVGSANKLEDYEEGTWTPTLPHGGTVGTIIKSVYTKVGNLVNAYCNVMLNPTNNVLTFYIGGLPFVGVSSNHGGGSLSYTGGMETRFWSGPLVDQYAQVYFHRHDASTATVQNNAFGGANRQFIMQVTYILA